MLHKITQIRRTRAGSNRLTVNVIPNQQPLGPEQLEAEGRNPDLSGLRLKQCDIYSFNSSVLGRASPFFSPKPSFSFTLSEIFFITSGCSAKNLRTFSLP